METNSKNEVLRRAGAVNRVTEASRTVNRVGKKIAFFEIFGTADLIQNNFSQKSLEQMLRKHMGHSVEREKKNPRQILEAAKIRNVAGRICVPANGLKKALLTAAGQVKSLKKTQLRTQMFVEGGSIPITYEEEIPRMDMVRTSGMARTPDVRFRPSFAGWKARVAISYCDVLSVDTLTDLLDRAGSVGLCEWRPEKDGSFGTFVLSTREIVSAQEQKEILEECAVPLVSLRIPEWAMDVDFTPETLGQIASGQEPEESEEDAAAETA